jgi:hypothetical protein
MAHVCAHDLKNVPPIWVPHANWECRHCFRRTAAADPATLDYDTGRLLEKLRRVFGKRK